MTINSLDYVSGARGVRLKVVLDAYEAKGAYQAEVRINNRMQASRFSASFALQLDPTHAQMWWSQQKDVPVSVFLGYEDTDGRVDWKLLLTGVTDHIHYHPVQNSIEIDGRDLASRLIDARTSETFANKRSSEIVQILAARHGLKADVTPTTTLAGTYYKLEHDKITLDGFSKSTTEWDLLVYLAKAENYDLYVEGFTLHFHPASKPDTSNPWLIRFTPEPAPGEPNGLNCTNLTCERSLTLAKDVKVTVKSWHSGKGGRVLAVYPKDTSSISGGGHAASSTGRGKLAGGGQVQNHVFIRPNLSQPQAEKEAERLHREITQNERIVNLTMPGDLLLQARNMIRLEGTGSTWDQTYYCEEITRSVSWDKGFEQTVRAKNSSPKNETSVG